MSNSAAMALRARRSRSSMYMSRNMYMSISRNMQMNSSSFTTSASPGSRLYHVYRNPHFERGISNNLRYECRVETTTRTTRRRSVHLYARGQNANSTRINTCTRIMATTMNIDIQKRNYLFFEKTRIHRLLQSIQTRLGLYVDNMNTKNAANLMKDEPILVALRTTKDEMMKRLSSRARNLSPFFYAKHGRRMKHHMNRNVKRLQSITRNVQRKHTKLRSLYAHRKSMFQKKGHQLLSRYSNSNHNININHNHNHKHNRHIDRIMEQTPRARAIINRLKCMTRSQWNTILQKGRIKLRHRYKRAMGIKMDVNHADQIIHNNEQLQQLDQIQHHAITIQEPFRKEWFSDVGGYPLTSKDPITGRYCNPWNSQSTNGLKHFAEVWRWKRTRFTFFTESFLDYTPRQLQLQMANHNRNHDHDDANDTRTSTCNHHHRVNGDAKYDSNVDDATIGDKEQYLQDHPKRVEALASPPPEDEVEMTWIGHATNLIRIGREFTVLTDPVFSHKASPFQMLDDFEFLGVPRFLPPSLSIQDLSKHLRGGSGYGYGYGYGREKIDVCVISHDHYDHLDWNSIQLMQDEKLVKFWAVPMGIKHWLLTNIHGIDENQIVEMEWWDSITFVKDSGNKDEALSGEEDDERRIPSLKIRGPISNMVKTNQVKDPHHCHSVRSTMNLNENNINSEYSGEYDKQQQASSSLTLTCAPAQHWCSRTPFDRNTRLWCSWAMHSKLILQDEAGERSRNETPMTSKDLSFYFAGDTGYPKEFPLHRQIGDVLGPFDLASIPIGAYKPRFFMQDSHCDPNEAVQIHQDIRSKRSVAIHWGTFPLANESFEEPPIQLLQAAKRAEEDFRILPHGHSIRSD